MQAPKKTAEKSRTAAAEAGRHWAWSDLAIALLVLAAAIWAYWRIVFRLWNEWQRDLNYSVGQLVPIAAIYLLLQRRADFARLTPRTNWLGLVLVVAAISLRFEGLRSLFESGERYSFVFLIWGLVLFLTGWQVFWRARWLLLFLLLMIPLPGRIHNSIAGPLQDAATTGTVFALETIGVAVERHGNTLELNGVTPVGIEEACSGLRMLTAFAVVACVLAFMIDGPAWQRVTLVISSIPLAIICNIARLAVTAMVFLHSDSTALKQFLHDFAGVLMMPLAIALLLLELWVLRKLTSPPAPATGAPHATLRAATAAQRMPHAQPE